MVFRLTSISSNPREKKHKVFDRHLSADGKHSFLFTEKTKARTSHAKKTPENGECLESSFLLANRNVLREPQ